MPHSAPSGSSDLLGFVCLSLIPPPGPRPYLLPVCPFLRGYPYAASTPLSIFRTKGMAREVSSFCTGCLSVSPSFPRQNVVLLGLYLFSDLCGPFQ